MPSSPIVLALSKFFHQKQISHLPKSQKTAYLGEGRPHAPYATGGLSWWQKITEK
jgi:hypothetical protein